MAGETQDYSLFNRYETMPGAARRHYPAKLSAIGDSITAVNEFEIGINGQSNAVYQSSWITYACLLSGGTLRRGRNAGIAGQTSVQMAARLNTDIISTHPGIVIILCGTNDVGQSVSAGGSTPDAVAVTNFQLSIMSMVNQISNAGAIPVLSTIPPNSASNRRALITKLNLWLKLFASISGLTILDFYGQSVDPTTGNYLASFNSGDGTHPGQPGSFILGQYVSNKLSPLVGVAAPFVAQDDSDPNNLITHPLFLGGALNAQGIPPGWQIASGFGTGLTVSYVTDSAVGGNMWQVAAAASSGAYYVQFPIAGTNWSVGDTIAVSGIITCNNGTLLPTVSIQNQSGTLSHQTFDNALTRGYFYFEQVVPTGTTNLYLQLNTPAGTGTWSVGQLGVYNLTKLGLIS